VSSETCTVLIAAADRLPQLKERVGTLNGETLDFSDAEALAALETIVRRRPQLVILERLFAATPRGAALINRIKADKKLATSEIRVFAHDSDFSRVVPRATAQATQALDQRGTRRAKRFKMSPHTVATVSGKTAVLIDLSTVGAQVVSPAAVKPRQAIAIGLMDREGSLSLTATVAWTSYEIPPNSGPRYRAGVEFVNASPADVDAFIARHRV